MAARFLRKFASLAFTGVFITAFWWASPADLTPTFQIYAKNGRPINNLRMEYFLDPDNSLRIGYEPRPELRVGFDSKHGLGIEFDF